MDRNKIKSIYVTNKQLSEYYDFGSIKICKYQYDCTNNSFSELTEEEAWILSKQLF
jgi:hypothetical protein